MKKGHYKSRLGYGVVVQPIDSSFKEDLRLVHFGPTIGVIFPAAYAAKKFGGTEWGKGRVFFTPDSNLVKDIDERVFSQYCDATKSYLEGYLSKQAVDTTAKNRTTILKAAKLIADKYCVAWKKDFTFYDRQYFGYTKASGERIIVIKFLDFRQDPYQLKPLLSVSWIDGWHGWFYSNIIQLNYQIDKNQLIIDEDI